VTTIIAQLSDPHIRVGPDDQGSARALANAVETLLALHPLPHAVLVTGDLADGGTAAEYDRFHELIASSTQNSGIIAAVQMLWDARARSPQSHSMDDKGRARGLKPPIDEHAAILRALKKRDPDAARAAMRQHISRVIEDMLKVTEVEEIQRARAIAAEKRRRYSSVQRKTAAR